MSGFGPSLAVGTCWVCSRRFLFDIDEVATVAIDPTCGEPPQPDDAAAVARAKRRQVCEDCARNVTEDRRRSGLPDLWNGRWRA